MIKKKLKEKKLKYLPESDVSGRASVMTGIVDKMTKTRKTLASNLKDMIPSVTFSSV